MRVCILGASLDVGNRGVSALGVSLARLLTRLGPGIELAFHYSHRSGGVKRLAGDGAELEVQVHNCRMSPRSATSQHIVTILALALLYRLGYKRPALVNPWLRSILSADFVGDVRAGDSFSDIYGLRRFLVGCLPLLSVAVLKRPYVMLPQTYGPFRRRIARAFAGALLRRAAHIVTRDRNCESIVQELCGRTPQFCPDLAFTLEALEPEAPFVTPRGLSVEGHDLVIGLNVSGLLYMGGYTGRNMFGLRSDYRVLIDALLERVLTSTSAKVLLVPHVFGSEQEEEACSSFFQSSRARHPGRVFRVSHALGEREVKWVIGRTDFFIGARMHACIAAMSQCVPTVGLAYSDKFLGVFESAGMGSAIVDLRKEEVGEVVARTVTAIHRRGELRQELTARIPAIQDHICQTVAELIGSAGQVSEAPAGGRDVRLSHT